MDDRICDIQVEWLHLANLCRAPLSCTSFCMGSARSYIARLLTQAGDAPLLLKTHRRVYFSGVVGLICNDDKPVPTSGGVPDNLAYQGLADISVSMLWRGDNGLETRNPVKEEQAEASDLFVIDKSSPPVSQTAVD